MTKHVLIYSPGNDIAGIGYAIKAAFDRHAVGWEARSVRRQDKWFDYPADIRWLGHDPHTETLVHNLWNKADVVHLMETFGDYGWAPKPRVIHHHGAVFTQDPLPIIHRAKSEGLPLLVSTFDMMAWGGVEWLPNPCDTQRLEALRQVRYVPSKRPRVVHSPSARGPKATDEFLAAFYKVRHRAHLELIERTPWARCLERKATGDILFDQLLIGYALTSIEAWGLGLAVLTGAADPTVTERTRQIIGFLPYLDTTSATLADDLARLVDDEKLRKEYADRGREAIARFHDEREVVRRLIAIYERALDEQKGLAA